MPSEYYLNNKEKILKARKEYRDKYPEKVKECKRISRLNNLESAKKRDKERYSIKKSDILKKSKEYYQKNKYKILLKHKEKRKELSKKAMESYYSNPIRRKKHIIRSQTKKEWKRGNIKKDFCILCGTKDNLNFHHENYNNWKSFKVLCKECHLKEHQKVGYKI